MKLNKEFIEKVSKSKGEPEWMLEFRLKSFEKFLELDNPSFGPKLDIDFDKINYYKKISDVTDSWDNVDKDIKKTKEEYGWIRFVKDNKGVEKKISCWSDDMLTDKYKNELKNITPGSKIKINYHTENE